MSGPQPPSSQQGKPRNGGGGRESSRGGGRVKVHLHAVTDEQAGLLMDTENARPLEEVKKKTGADVHFDPNPSPVPGMKIVIIRGVPSQIEAVVRLIRQMTGSQEDIVKIIRKKLRDAVSQLNKAEAMLSHLVSDVCPGLRITKTIAVPNLTTRQVQQAISHDSQLTERKAQTTDDSSETLGPAQRRALSTMSDKQPSAPQQGKPRKRGGGRESSRGGGRVKVHLHAVTDEQAALLMDTVNARPLEEVKKKTGADVHFDPNPSPVPGMKIVIIRGVPSQIEEVVRLIREMTGSQATLTEEVQTFWLQWVEAAYPDLESRAYFLPPVYFNRVPMTTETVAGQDVQVLLSATQKSPSATAASACQDVVVLDSPSEKASKRRGLLKKVGSLPKSSKTHEPQQEAVLPSNTPVMTPSETAETFISHPATAQDSDIRDDTAMKQVLLCLQSLSEKTGEVLVGITRLHFTQYLSEPCFSVAAAQLPRASSLPPDLPQSWKQGNFDVLLIHRHYGLVVCNVMSFGDMTNDLKMSQEDIVKTIRKKLRDAVSQLNKAEAMLSHLVSDVCPGLRITKTIAVPNLTTDQVQQAISHDSQLTEDLHCCLKTTDPADIAGVCLCCDQLCDPETPCDVSSHVLKKLGEWWKRRVAVSGPDSHMTRHMYKTLVARVLSRGQLITDRYQVYPTNHVTNATYKEPVS
ncbi:uncharacterized protein LOC112554924 isoform X2 [Pomacea canaliculata]|uniref:uncharacterized protein LOC112554924 isoform X2 n=1 Tax=Pomacea canaliculata TaxID=400727 RepID=UPI000D727D3C|nr:uncharacterized protein LOC112554924 isoform X2 [Pomacea canaliculata]